MSPEVYEGSGPADDEDEDEDERPAREAELESALSRAERDSIASRQGKLRAGFDGAGAAGRDVCVSVAEDEAAAAEAGDDEDDEDENEEESRIVEAGLGGDRSGRWSRRPANRRA